MRRVPDAPDCQMRWLLLRPTRQIAGCAACAGPTDAPDAPRVPRPCARRAAARLGRLLGRGGALACELQLAVVWKCCLKVRDVL